MYSRFIESSTACFDLAPSQNSRLPRQTHLKVLNSLISFLYSSIEAQLAEIFHFYTNITIFNSYGVVNEFLPKSICSRLDVSHDRSEFTSLYDVYTTFHTVEQIPFE